MRTRAGWGRMAIGLALAAGGCNFVGGGPSDAGPRRDAGGTDAAAATGLVPCDSSSTDPACVNPVEGTPLGPGPHVSDNGRLTNGSIDAANNRLVVGGDWGAVLAFDLNTGARTLVAGKVTDPTTGSVTQRPAASGGMLPPIVDVLVTSTGQLVAVSNTAFYRVDATTGAFTMLASVDTAHCVDGAARPLTNIILNQGVGIGPSDEMFFFAQADGGARGVAGLSADGRTCRVVSMWIESGRDQPPAGVLRGTGPGISYVDAYGFRYRAGALWISDVNYGALRMDIATGDFRRVGNADPSGGGCVSEDLDVNGNGTELVRYGNDINTRTNSTCFDRTNLTTDVTMQVGGRFVWSRGTQSDSGSIWFHPSRPLYVAIAGDAMIFVDPVTGLLNRISQ